MKRKGLYLHPCKHYDGLSIVPSKYGVLIYTYQGNEGIPRGNLFLTHKEAKTLAKWILGEKETDE